LSKLNQAAIYFRNSCKLRVILLGVCVTTAETLSRQFYSVHCGRRPTVYTLIYTGRTRTVIYCRTALTPAEKLTALHWRAFSTVSCLHSSVMSPQATVSAAYLRYIPVCCTHYEWFEAIAKDVFQPQSSDRVAKFFVSHGINHTRKVAQNRLFRFC